MVYLKKYFFCVVKVMFFEKDGVVILKLLEGLSEIFVRFEYFVVCVKWIFESRGIFMLEKDVEDVKLVSREFRKVFVDI